MPVTLPVKSARKITYIAGPMRGYPKFNFEAFFDAEDSLKRLGWEVLSPARMDLDAHPEVNGDPDKLPIKHMWEYVERDVDALIYLAKLAKDGADVAIHFLPGWEKSTGAKAESAVGDWLGIRKVYL